MNLILELQQRVEAAEELTESHPIVQQLAVAAGVSAYSVMTIYRRLRGLASAGEIKTRQVGSLGGGSWASLGYIRIPEQTRGVVRRDGWRACTVGPDEEAARAADPRPAVLGSEDEEPVPAGGLQRFKP